MCSGVVLTLGWDTVHMTHESSRWLDLKRKGGACHSCCELWPGMVRISSVEWITILYQQEKVTSEIVLGTGR